VYNPSGRQRPDRQRLRTVRVRRAFRSHHELRDGQGARRQAEAPLLRAASGDADPTEYFKYVASARCGFGNHLIAPMQRKNIVNLPTVQYPSHDLTMARSVGSKAESKAGKATVCLAWRLSIVMLGFFGRFENPHSAPTAIYQVNPKHKTQHITHKRRPLIPKPKA